MLLHITLHFSEWFVLEQIMCGNWFTVMDLSNLTTSHSSLKKEWYDFLLKCLILLQLSGSTLRDCGNVLLTHGKIMSSISRSVIWYKFIHWQDSGKESKCSHLQWLILVSISSLLPMWIFFSFLFTNLDIIDVGVLVFKKNVSVRIQSWDINLKEKKLKKGKSRSQKKRKITTIKTRNREEKGGDWDERGEEGNFS